MKWTPAPKQIDEKQGQLSRVVISILCLQGQWEVHSALQQVLCIEATHAQSLQDVVLFWCLKFWGFLLKQIWVLGPTAS